jgi:hypothetical protein
MFGDMKENAASVASSTVVAPPEYFVWAVGSGAMARETPVGGPMVGAVGGSVVSSLHAARAATDSRQQVERVAGCISLSSELGGVSVGAHAAVAGGRQSGNSGAGR